MNHFNVNNNKKAHKNGFVKGAYIMIKIYNFISYGQEYVVNKIAQILPLYSR